jgi:dipeptidase E
MEPSQRRLLLVSTSTLHGQGYLDHSAPAIADLLGSRVERVVFVPYALRDRDAYTAKVRERFASLGYELESVHEASGRDGPVRAVREAQAVFVGGGNTFRLLGELHARGLVEAIRERALDGMPYVGSSAGSNVACATIQTTNDMPIVYPPTFAALGLVPFNVNPHYLDPDPGSTHMGETREQRIREFHEEEDRPVVGLREGAMLWIEGNSVTLIGSRGARLFQRGREPEEFVPGAKLDFLLGS